MGFLNRLLARRETASSRPANLLALPADNFQRVVGESHCQEVLQAISRQTAPGPEGRPSFAAALIPEPQNPYDRDAIAVHCAAGRVGYLSREDAQAFKRVLRHVTESGYDGVSCVGILNGGTRDKPNYGVVLTLSFPESCETFLGIASRRTADTATPVARRTGSGPGMVRGRHYTTYAEEVKILRRHGHEDDAEPLLLELVDAIEAEARAQGLGVAPWYYEQLAILYRKHREAAAEVAILERFAAQPHAPGASPPKLFARLEAARQRLGDDAGD